MSPPPLVLLDLQAERWAQAYASCVAAGLPVVPARSAQDVSELLARLQPQLLLLGVPTPYDLPDLCADLARWASVPILLLLDGQPNDAVAALLAAGADDYLRTPFTPETLRARVAGLLRRAASAAELLHVGNGELVLHPHARAVQVRGALVELTQTEYALLLRLAGRAGAALTYAELLADADPHAALDPSYLTAYIWHLRQKLERDPRQPQLLLGVDGVGYRLLP